MFVENALHINLSVNSNWFTAMSQNIHRNDDNPTNGAVMFAINRLMGKWGGQEVPR